MASERRQQSMGRTSAGWLAIRLSATAAFAQTASPDSQLTLAMLGEVRQLAQDLQDQLDRFDKVLASYGRK